MQSWRYPRGVLPRRSNRFVRLISPLSCSSAKRHLRGFGVREDWRRDSHRQYAETAEEHHHLHAFELSMFATTTSVGIRIVSAQLFQSRFSGSFRLPFRASFHIIFIGAGPI